MAKIPLRTYNREIEAMIDRGQASQAINHCLHILKFFPKHIDTYRLLGKAFLEMQKYSEAADVLQRVLASVPDDFISQIGMGIIREDEGNLDAAIWHMERAFEVQPSNIGVREELRRLYGKRDGVLPEKIRLTRGALVRMYARGELYQQAIAEIRVALLEDPQRVDLEALLARMYFLSGQKVAATEVCTRLISKLPFCFEANRILAEVLPESTRAEDAKRYLARVHAMDPYLAHLSPDTLTPAEVPDSAVELEKLEWMPEYEAGQPAEWAKVIGTEWTTEGEAIPDWITGAMAEEIPAETEEVIGEQTPLEETPVSEEIKAEAPFTVDIPLEEEAPEPQVKPEPAEQIPDWMQQAGWQPATGETTEEPGGFIEPEKEAGGEGPAEDIEQAEIPEWLAALAPTEVEEPDETEKPESTEWLKSILSETPEADTSAASEGETLSEESLEIESAGFADMETPGDEEIIQKPERELPEEFESAAEAEETGEIAEMPEEEGAGESQSEVQAEEVPMTEAEPIHPAAEELQPPDWLADLQTPSLEPAGEAETELPSWLEELTIETPQSAPEGGEAPIEEWLNAGPFEPAPEPYEESKMEEPEITPTSGAEMDLGDTQPVKIKREEPSSPVSEPKAEPAPETPSEEADFDQTMSWLEGLTAKEAEEEEVPAAMPEDLGGTAPEWVQEITAEEELTVEQPEEASESMPPWMQDITEETPAGQAEETGAAAPEWMQEFTAEEAELASAEQVEASTEAAPVEEELEPLTLPEEILEETEGIGAIFDEEFHRDESVLGEAATEEEAPTLEAPTEELLPQAEESAPEPAEMEIGPSDQFLEALGALQSETLSEPVEGTPAFIETMGEPAEEIASEAEGEGVAGPVEEELPDWLRQMMAGEGEEEAEAVTPEAIQPTEPSSEAALGWLQELAVEEETPAEEPLSERQAEHVEPPTAPGAFIEEESILKSEETPEEGLPEWLRGVDEEKGAEEPLAEFNLDQIAAEVEGAEAEPEWTEEIAPAESVAEPSVEDTAPFKLVGEAEEIGPSQVLKQAQAALEAHNVERALEAYDQLIKSGQHLEDIIHDLRDALYRYPIDVSIWQLLGDAYMKSNRLQDALDAYTKAEELLR